jgi:hypothetical protein
VSQDAFAQFVLERPIQSNAQKNGQHAVDHGWMRAIRSSQSTWRPSPRNGRPPSRSCRRKWATKAAYGRGALRKAKPFPVAGSDPLDARNAPARVQAFAVWIASRRLSKTKRARDPARCASRPGTGAAAFPCACHPGGRTGKGRSASCRIPSVRPPRILLRKS